MLPIFAVWVFDDTERTLRKLNSQTSSFNGFIFLLIKKLANSFHLLPMLSAEYLLHYRPWMLEAFELMISHNKKGLNDIHNQYQYLDEMRHAYNVWYQQLKTSSSRQGFHSSGLFGQ